MDPWIEPGEQADAVAAAAPPEAAPVPCAPLIGGERAIGRVLRSGALASGALFVASLALELLPVSQGSSIVIDHLQKAAASVLLVTPVARLVVSGVVLGMRGEWKYAFLAGAIVLLLALAMRAGMSA